MAKVDGQVKAQTRDGEVEFTAEMVRPGMVLRFGSWNVVVLGDGLRRSQNWMCTIDGKPGTMDVSVLGGNSTRLLGCDPAIAAREDVERFGVAPGIDAGAHGFARLRGGGAVDLRRGCPDGCITEEKGQRQGPFAFHRLTIDKQARFVGLNARHARPEDIARLCCNEIGPAGPGEDEPSCTLAVGDHAHHEDLATGVRWPARPIANTWHARADIAGTAENAQRAEIERLYGKHSGTTQMVEALLAMQVPSVSAFTVEGANIPPDFPRTGVTVGVDSAKAGDYTGYAFVDGRGHMKQTGVIGARSAITTWRGLSARCDGFALSTSAITCRLSFDNTIDDALLRKEAQFPDNYNKWQAALLNGEKGELAHPAVGKVVAAVANVCVMSQRPSGVVVAVTFRYEASGVSFAFGTFGDRSRTSALAKALRGALPSIDRLPLPAADRKALHAAAHAVCEAAEAACEGDVPLAVQTGAAEMVTLLSLAAHAPVLDEAQQEAERVRAAMKARPK